MSLRQTKSSRSWRRSRSDFARLELHPAAHVPLRSLHRIARFWFFSPPASIGRASAVPAEHPIWKLGWQGADQSWHRVLSFARTLKLSIQEDRYAAHTQPQFWRGALYLRTRTALPLDQP